MTQTATAPGDVAESITGRRHISWSQIQCYQKCPMQFRLKYVDDCEPEFQPSALVFGNAFHQAVELFYEFVLAGEQCDLGTLVSCFGAAWDAGENVRLNKTETEESVKQQAERMLAAFVDSPEANPRGNVIAIEEEMAGPVDPELPNLLARVDLVEQERDGLVTITDLKTARCRWNGDKILENEPQLQLYGDVAARTGLAPVGKIKLRFLVVTKAVKPAIQSLEIPHDDDCLQRTKGMVRDVWSGIVAGIFPARPSWVCRQCQFRGYCEAVGD